MTKKIDSFVTADLISRYLKEELSYEELEQLRKWANMNINNQRLLEELANGEALGNSIQIFSSIDKAEGWRKLIKAIHKSSEQRRVPIFKYWRYVAAAIVFGVLYFAILSTYKNESSELTKIETPVPKYDMLPGGDKATLTLADGSIVSLEEIVDGTIKEENGIRISKENGQITYEIVKQGGVGEVFYNTIHTPVGGQYHIILPDGSKVWLNSESSLRFPTAFIARERKVDLVGEGYFEIAKNTALPFLVQTQKTSVKVLGTHFNVMAYSNEIFSKTTLMEGSVEVSDGVRSSTIQPGQQAITGSGINIINVHPDEVIAWKSGYFQFESEDLKAILRQLKRWYGFEIVDENLIPNKHFTAYISRNTTLSQVLKMLEMSGELKFKIEGQKLYIQKTS